MMTARRLSMEARFSDTRSANISSATIWLVYAYGRRGGGGCCPFGIYTQCRGRGRGGGASLQ